MVRRLTLPIAVASGALALAAAPGCFRDDDRPVDPSTPAARHAAAIALDVVPGRVLGVARDEDDGKWEITIAQAQHEYEVELAPGDLRLLRLDYD
jgi:hypothetical protein